VDYTELITRSWNIVWKNRALWVLGFLAGLAANGIRTSNNYSSNSSEMSPEMMATLGAMVLLFSCVAIIIAVVMWVLGVVARGGLIGSVWALDDDETATLTVGEALQPGMKAFWRMVGVNILLYLPVWLFSMAMVVVIVVMAGGTAVFASIASNPDDVFNIIGPGFAMMGFLFCILLCLMIPLGIVLQLIQEFAVRGTVVRNLGVVDSIKHGWEVLRGNVGEILLLGLLFVGVGIAASMAVGVVMLPLAFLAMAPLMGSMYSGGEMSMLTGFWMLCSGLGMTIIGAILLSVFTAWRSAAFTLAYKQFTGKHVESASDDLEPKFL